MHKRGPGLTAPRISISLSNCRCKKRCKKLIQSWAIQTQKYFSSSLTHSALSLSQNFRVYCLRLCRSLVKQWFPFFFNDGAKATATQAASVSLNIFTRPGQRAKLNTAQ